MLKIKINSVMLILIILVEIVLVEAIIVFSLIKNEHINIPILKKSSKMLTSKTKKVIKPELQAVKASKKPSKKFSLFMTEDQFLSKIHSDISLNYPVPRDIRLPEDITEDSGFYATAYDLSYICCGKYPDDPLYGITFSGRSAKKGVTIAVDPSIIPIGSRVHIELEKKYSYLDGWYLAEDTGSKVKGKIIDIFFGKSASAEMKEFGRRKIRIRIIPPL